MLFPPTFLSYNPPASPDNNVSFPPGKTYSSSSNNSFGLVPIASPTLSLFHDDPYMKVMHAYYAEKSPKSTLTIVPPSSMLSPMFNPQEFFLPEELLPLKKRGCDRSSSSTSALPQAFVIGESSRKTSLERHKEQIEEILNHLDELSLDRIEHIKDKIEGLGKWTVMPPKRTSTSEAPAMTQAAIRKLVADNVTATLEAQAATMANADNTNRNTREREAHIARKCSYKEFMSCQPINFKDSEGAVGLICCIEGNVTASKPQTLEEAINIAQRNNQIITNHNRTEDRKPSGLMLSLQLKKWVGHLTKNCRNKGPATGSNLLPVTVTCHACGEKGHYANQCRKTTNNNAQGRAYMLRDRNAHQDPNVVTGMFLLNQHLARVLFDSGADKSFVSISLASMLNIPPITIDTFYNIEMADGNLVSTNTVIQGCTLTLLNQPFEIDLMPIKLGSFDVVIGMDWLSKYHARIICDEKVVHIPINGETLIIRVMEKKSDEKRLEDIPVVREFPEVFPEDLPGLPPVRQIEVLSDQVLRLGELLSYLSKRKTDLSECVSITEMSIDDILIYSRNKEEHANHLRIILELLKKEKLYAKFSKCDFWIHVVQFLGHLIDSQGLHVDPAMIEAVKNWTSPTTPTEIHQFLGLAGY
ncbi:putative reverse transcriptase domain-containing protein [Tanacetum coccineum]